VVGQIISWIVFGLIVGLIARALYPGQQRIGLPNTIALGIAGSLVGGFMGRLISGGDADDGVFTGAGWFMSIIGALIVVWIASYLSRRGD
jgi:uncharacterized membrane protein YeaQ/YmgE (transglycosylase-associated protein family)